MKMAAAADLSTPLAILDGKCMGKENGSLSDANNIEDAEEVKSRKPPRHGTLMRHCASTARLEDAGKIDLGIGNLCLQSDSPGPPGFLPVFRSGSCTDIGQKKFMEDEHICVDNLIDHLGVLARIPSPGAFYGVFDGHDGKDAAAFVQKNILNFIIKDDHFPSCIQKAIKSAFVRADYAIADDKSVDNSSGTTALTALIFGRTLHIANVGDCRAVLGKRGRAVELSRDHKPSCNSERLRIEKLGGFIYDGYLNGQLSVARALGDWHMKGPKGSECPLSAEPELQEMTLAEEDEFLIMACDGLWDVMTSQCAVTITRRELIAHNDPEKCSRELVRQALKRKTCDNLTVVVICFSPYPPPRIEVPRSGVRRCVSAEGINLLKGIME
ncbi:probable protein phosphatase 2C 27 [Typha angustifolia]|uniref:probable protein phosphatase 2C 27 n=1 Tax=Typha angustifolia TaxID=59011 RepID=UPI003C2C717E